MTLHTLFRDRRVATVEVVPGIETPLRFTDSRVEHTAARQTVGLFDFSFMACFDVAGPEAIRYLERVQTRRVRSMRLGQVAYTLLCREDGTVLNDATLWCRAGAHFTLFTGRRADRAHLLECATGLEVEIHDMSATRAACAVQGPLALRTLQAAMPGHPWETLPYFGFRTIEFDGVACDVARLG